MMRKNKGNDSRHEEQASLLFSQQERSCWFAQKSERNRSMMNTSEKDTNDIIPQAPEELSEQDMQAVNGGAKIGNPMEMLNDVLRNPRTPGRTPPLSRSSSMNSFGIREMHETNGTPVRGSQLGPSARAEIAATVTGTVAAYGVGFVSSASKKS
jgi:hypothetical protein